MKKYLAEFIGTFALVFAGTGAIIIDEVSSGSVTHAGFALTLGLIVLAMIYWLPLRPRKRLLLALQLYWFLVRSGDCVHPRRTRARTPGFTGLR